MHARTVSADRVRATVLRRAPIRAWLPALAALAFAACATAATDAGPERVTARALLTSGVHYNNRLVVVSGRLVGSQLHPGPVPTYTFAVDDGTQLVPVVAHGAPVCPASRDVTVEGWYRVDSPAGFGQIEALSVRCH